MSDDKRSLLPEKSNEEIPLPAIAPVTTPDKKTTKPYKYWFKCFAASSLLFLVVHRYIESFRPEIEAETEAWLANPFSHGPHWPGRGHHRPILNGKAAEKLFLCVSTLSREYLDLTSSVA